MNHHHRRRASSSEAVQAHVIANEEPLFAVPEMPETRVGRRRWPIVLVGVGLTVAATLAATATYLLTRGPDLAAFHTDLKQTSELSRSVQAKTERLAAPAGLAGFHRTLTRATVRFDELERSAQAVDQTRNRLALLDAIEASRRYVKELD